jgi:hypothetical protein
MRFGKGAKLHQFQREGTILVSEGLQRVEDGEIGDGVVVREVVVDLSPST